jgi:hypothetical protein
MSAIKAHIDFETRSAVDLRKAGMHRYAEDLTTEIVCMSWRLGDGRVQRWRPCDPIPHALGQHIRFGGQVVAHNSGFERAIWSQKMCWLRLPIENQDCTMARAAAMGLPASLENLGAAIDADIQKDKDGHRLMLKMCKPKTLDPLTWHEDPNEIERLQAYCDQDVLTECAIDARLPPLSDRERKVWRLDQKINDRGVAIDLPLVRRAQDAVGAAKKAADDKIWRLTNGAIRRTTEAAKITNWLAARGIATKSIADSELDDLLIATELFDDETAAAVLALRRASSKAFKFQAMLDTVCRDGRVRGSLAYHGAHTGRWAGRGMQPQNFKRVQGSKDEAEVASALEALRAGQTPDLHALSLCARAMIIAPPGKKLVSGDFSNVEGRINAWLAGEDWKLAAFGDYDRGEGPDLYRLAYARGFDLDPEAVDDSGRQIGKVMELALGYQGGVGAFQTMAVNYDVRVSDSRADTLKRAWRDANPRITQSWWDLNDACIEAVGSPGTVVSALSDHVRYTSNGAFLFCRLPSGRVLSYAKPSVGWKSRVITIDGDEVEINSRGVSYWGVHAGRWQKLDLYGGSLCNHIVQGTARDLLVEAMFKVEAAGYPVVLTIHDEILSEVDEGFGSAKHYEQLMSDLPPWAEGLPVATKAWEDGRYSK